MNQFRQVDFAIFDVLKLIKGSIAHSLQWHPKGDTTYGCIQFPLCYARFEQYPRARQTQFSEETNHVRRGLEFFHQPFVPIFSEGEAFRSEERKVLIIPALTLFSSLLKASASSASRVSWLMKTNGVPEDVEDNELLSVCAFAFSESLMMSPENSTLSKSKAIHSLI